ncbi:MAG: hypothetical protein ABIC91_08805 [Nanoarchaeota archaeon]|nr:hypothetical protein [Nanoarchaeota archaeon]MBU1030471.1 hypothetical protein [Nanoarchaeota archaeon]MBU1850678.1 hypothetical protein [Nanoarchaeota archaeon]
MNKILISILVLLALFVAGCDIGPFCGDGYCDISENALGNCPEDCNFHPKFCKDSDGGKDYFTKGEVDVSFGNIAEVHLDHCDNKFILQEQICVNADAVSIEFDCSEENAVCYDGQCIEEDEPIIVPEPNSAGFSVRFAQQLKEVSVPRDAFPILKNGVVEDDNGDETYYTQFIKLGDASVDFKNPDNDIYSEPMLLLDMLGPIWSYEFNFPESLDIYALDDGESIELLGEKFFFKNIARGDDVVLYKNLISGIVELDTPQIITVDGKNYELEVVGANPDSNEIILSVNGNKKTFWRGQLKVVDGLRIYAQDVFISTIGEGSASMKYAIVLEYNLGKVGNFFNQLKVDAEDLKGVEAKIVPGQNDWIISKIVFRINPEEIQNPATGEKYDWLAIGDSFKDPLFGFELLFDDVVPQIGYDTRGLIEFASDNDLEIGFENSLGKTYELDMYAHSDGQIVWANNFMVADSFQKIPEDSIFIVEDEVNNMLVSNIFKLVNIDTHYGNAYFRDVSTDEQFVVKNGTELLNTGSYLSIVSEETITLSKPTKNYFRTGDDVVVRFSSPKDSLVFIQEPGYSDFYLNVSLENNELILSKPMGVSGRYESASSDDKIYGVTGYGSYWIYNNDNNRKITFLTPSEEARYVFELTAP